MWKKDVIAEIKASLEKMGETMASALAHGRDTSRRSGEGDGERKGGRRAELDPLRQIELFSRNLGTIVPGLSQFSSGLRNVRLGLEAFGKFTDRGVSTAKLATAVAARASAAKASPSWADIGENFLRASYAGKLNQRMAETLAVQVRARKMSDIPAVEAVGKAGGMTQAMKNGAAALANGGIGGRGRDGDGGPGGLGAGDTSDGRAGPVRRALPLASLMRFAAHPTVLAAAGVAAGTLGVGAGLIAGPPLIARSAGKTLESQRSLAEVSGSMAAVFANYDMQQMFRNRQLGEQTSDSARYLAGSLADFKRLSLPRDVLAANTSNAIKTFFLGGGRAIESGLINPIATQLNERLFGPGTSTTDAFGRLGNALGFAGLSLLPGTPAWKNQQIANAIGALGTPTPQTPAQSPLATWLGQIAKQPISNDLRPPRDPDNPTRPWPGAWGGNV